MAEVHEDLTGRSVPDELSFSLNLPVDDLFYLERGGVEEHGSDGAHGFGADASGETLAQPMRVIREEKVLGVEVDEGGFVIECGELAGVVRDETEGSGGEGARGVDCCGIGGVGDEGAGGGADAGLVDLGWWRRREGSGFGFGWWRRCGCCGEVGWCGVFCERRFRCGGDRAARHENQLSGAFEADVVFERCEDGGAIGSGAYTEGNFLEADDLSGLDDFGGFVIDGLSAEALVIFEVHGWRS